MTIHILRSIIKSSRIYVLFVIDINFLPISDLASSLLPLASYLKISKYKTKIKWNNLLLDHFDFFKIIAIIANDIWIELLEFFDWYTYYSNSFFNYSCFLIFNRSLFVFKSDLLQFLHDVFFRKNSFSVSVKSCPCCIFVFDCRFASIYIIDSSPVLEIFIFEFFWIFSMFLR